MRRILFCAVVLCLMTIVMCARDVYPVSAPPAKQLILVSLAEQRLYFLENDELVMTFPVRIGKPKTPTPVGEGVISKKRDDPVFRYVDPGPNQGKIVTIVDCEGAPDGKTIARPFAKGKTRALVISIHGTMQYSIHSTVCTESIGKALSLGCIGVRVDDMLTLYARVRVGARIVISSA